MPPKKKNPKRARDGASTSSRPPRVDFDARRFTSLDNFLLYEKLKGNNMIVKKSIHPRIDSEVTIRAEFDKIG